MTVDQNRIRFTLIIIALLIWALQLGGYLGRLYIGDDLLWYYFTGNELTFPATTTNLKKELASALARVGADQGYVVRYELLNKYSTNYPFVSATYAAVSSGIRALEPGLPFSGYLTGSLIAANLIFATVALAVVGVVAAGVRNGCLIVGFVLAIALEALVLPYKSAFFAPFYGATFWNGLGAALHHLLVPGPEFTMLNTGPRNLLAGLTLAVFLLRWSGRVTASYWLLLGLIFIHQSTTLLVMGFVIAVDLVLRPATLLKSGVPIVAAILLGVVREQVWHMTGLSASTLIYIVCLAAAVLAGMYFLPRRYFRLSLPLGRLREAAASHSPMLVETVGFLAFWFATLPLPYFVNKYVDPFQNYYFWSVLHTRSLGVMHPSLLMGLIATACISLRLSQRIRTAIVACLLGAACLQAIIRETPSLQNPYPRMRLQVEELERQLAGLSAIGTPELMNGPLVYIGMIKAAEGVDDRFNRLLVAAPKPIP